MKIPQKLQELLDTCGVPYELKPGSKHIKIMVGSRFAGILPRKGGHNSAARAQLNVLAQVKRAIKMEIENVQAS